MRSFSAGRNENIGAHEKQELPARYIIHVRVDATSYADTIERVLDWARAAESRYVSVATVNNVMRAYESCEFRRIMLSADLVTPDGMPLVWGLRLLGINHATRVYGPDLTPALLQVAERERLPVAFYGSTKEVIGRLVRSVHSRYPRLEVVYCCAPPFRPPTTEESAKTARDINASGARLVFVGLSTPKQEYWMFSQKGEIRAVMLGVGAAFDFLAGSKRQAPRWMMPLGMEWFFRLITEPRRLWSRYLKDNPRFLFLFARQLLSMRASSE